MVVCYFWWLKAGWSLWSERWTGWGVWVGLIEVGGIEVDWLTAQKKMLECVQLCWERVWSKLLEQPEAAD